MRRAFLSLAVVALAGCGAQTGFGTARVLAPGASEGAVFLEGSLVTARLDRTTDVPLPLIQGGIAYRRGLTEGFELGARAWGLRIRGFASFGASLDGKTQLAESGRVHVALVTSLGYHQVRLGGTPSHVFSGTLPLLIGVDLGRDQLFFGPRLSYGIAASYGANAVSAAYYGLSLGYAWRWTRTFTFVPEVVWMYSPVRFNGEIDDPNRRGSNALQLAVGGIIDF